MKKIYLLSALALAFGSASAQRTFVSNGADIELPRFVNSGDRAPSDTLWPTTLANDTLALYFSPNGGYMAGNNGFGDLAKGQQFEIVGNAMEVEEVAFLFGAKMVSANPGMIMARVWALDGTTGTTTVGTGQPCPGTQLGTADVSMTDVDTSGIMFVSLNTPAYVSGKFVAGFDMSLLNAGDTLGLISTDGNDPSSPEHAWEKFSDGTWFTMKRTPESWGFDGDLAIWAIIGPGNVGIDGNTFLNGMKLTIANNPVVDNATILFELEKAADVRLEVIGMNGQKVFTADKGEMTAGRHQMEVTGLANGTYLVNLSANGRNLTKKLNVVK